jgi:formylglycine-generating enzyme required for sulfatase activity
MLTDPENLPPGPPPRRFARRAGIAVALTAVAWAMWYFGIELPNQREEAAAAKLRAANARTIPDLNLDLVWMAPGSFLMGTPEQSVVMKWFYVAREKLTGKRNPELLPINTLKGGGPLVPTERERPLTWVMLTQPFWLGRTAVTQGQYEVVMGNNPSHFTAAGKDAPVEQVSWDDAMAFCQKLTEREKAAGRLPSGYAYTLPTEAQREFACRAGTTGDYAGDLDAMAWYSANIRNTTHTVGTKQPNGWGLYDMHGNVWEWCRDWYGAYPGGEVTNPVGPPSSSGRVIRGGSWNLDAAYCRSGFRLAYVPGIRDYGLGFRLALAPSP